MEDYFQLTEKHFADGKIELWGLKYKNSGWETEWHLIETYQAEMPEILTMGDVKAEDAGRGFYKEN